MSICPRAGKTYTANDVLQCIKEHRKEGKIPKESEGCSGCMDSKHRRKEDEGE
jgi:hypothetical protein